MMNSRLGLLAIRPASQGELSVVMDIYDEAAQWLHSKGIHYWMYPQPLSIWDLVEDDIQEECVFLCRIQADGRAVGTIRVLWADSAMWPEEAGDAGYIHGLATRTEARGQGVGAAMLGWAKGHVRAHGKKYIRLDCEASNPVLRQYYEKLGFVFRGEITHDGYVGARYEMAL
jgi:ribosomal protein S18 acetylase RimI-like enzyme